MILLPNNVTFIEVELEVLLIQNSMSGIRIT